MQTTYVYDYELVDSIRQQEQRYQAALEKAKESVRQLAASVERLKESRLAMECETDD
jgi:cell division protein FtsB